MGKKLKGAKLRAKKRGQLAVEELQEKQAEVVATQAVTDVADEHLFVVDTKGDKSVHVPRTDKLLDSNRPNKKFKKYGLSLKEQAQVDALIQKSGGDASRLKEIAEKGRKILDSARQGHGGAGRRKRLVGNRSAKFDLWNEGNNPTNTDKVEKVGEGKDGGDEAKKEKSPVKDTKREKEAQIKDSKGKQKDGYDDAVAKPGIGSYLAGIRPDSHVKVKALPLAVEEKLKNSSVTGDAVIKTSAGVAVDVAKAGQSYHPDPLAHNKILMDAVNVEKRRNDAIVKKTTPIAQGLSEETRALLLGDSSSEEESSDEEEGEEEGVLTPKKQRDKLTRAQRNKQKRLRQEQKLIDEARRKKKLMKEVGEVGRYKKELKRAAREREEKKEQIAQLKKQQERLPGKDIDQHVSKSRPIDAPTVPVALSMELRSSLRSIKPKGSLVSDRMASLIDRKLAPAPRKRDGLSKEDRYNARKKRKLSLKGKKNNVGVGPDFVVLG